MTRRAKFMFAGCVLAHAILSWFSTAWCAGVSMAILDSGRTEAPPSLIAMCWAELICKWPLAPLTQTAFGKFEGYGPRESYATYWVLVVINSFLAISLIYFVFRIVGRLLLPRSKFAHEKT
jgi:hypothetical protein